MKLVIRYKKKRRRVAKAQNSALPLLEPVADLQKDGTKKNTENRIGIILKKKYVLRNRFLFKGGASMRKRLPEPTATTLAIIDDIASSLVLDPALRFASHKITPKFKGPGPEDKLRLLKLIERFIETQDYEYFYLRLVKGGFLKGCPAGYYGAMRRQIFLYLGAYHKTSGYAVQPCYRYSLEKQRGHKIVSKKKFKAGETVNMLKCRTKLTKTCDKSLITSGKNEFYLMLNARGDGDILCSGPGTFLNHSCKPNAEFVAKGRYILEVKAVQDINLREEITINYGNDYFGPNNEGCECKICKV